MQSPLQITFRGLSPSDAIESHIRRRAEALERFFGQITSCSVLVEAPHQRRTKGRLYSVRLDIRAPGSELVVSQTHRRHHAHEDVHVAIRDAFEAAVRQLEDHARRRRHKVKHHEVPDHGRVLRIYPERGYGFLGSSDGTEVYFHEHSVVHGSFFDLRPGDEVRFVRSDHDGEKGPQASTVGRVGKHHLVSVSP